MSTAHVVENVFFTNSIVILSMNALILSFGVGTKLGDVDDVSSIVNCIQGCTPSPVVDEVVHGYLVHLFHWIFYYLGILYTSGVYRPSYAIITVRGFTCQPWALIASSIEGLYLPLVSMTSCTRRNLSLQPSVVTVTKLVQVYGLATLVLLYTTTKECNSIW